MSVNAFALFFMDYRSSSAGLTSRTHHEGADTSTARASLQYLSASAR
jgi:hypothetical protein